MSLPISAVPSYHATHTVYTYNLELYSFTFQFNGSDFLHNNQTKRPSTHTQTNKTTYEIDTNGRDITLGVGIVSKTEQKTRLSNSRIANKQKLKQIIAISHVNI